MDASFRSGFPAVTRWFVTLANQPNFSAVVGDVKLCETPRKFTREPPHCSCPWDCRATGVFVGWLWGEVGRWGGGRYDTSQDDRLCCVHAKYFLFFESCDFENHFVGH